ncbi:MAG: heavy-metal-associated domain-containing protein [Acidobacteria bacterium]|nr:heavy-metal-associated domain-containing protein [Acidobacteriota bacterium]
MKFLLIVGIVLSVAVLGVGGLGNFSCAGFSSVKPSSIHVAELKTSIFRVEGMTCGGCAAGLRAIMKKIDGVQKVKASYEERKAIVTYNPAKIKPDQIIAAIEKLGYSAKLQKIGGTKN